MGGAVGYLLCQFCQSGCQASVVASALAFHPPVPYYQITRDESTGKFNVEFDSELPEVPFYNLKIEILETRSKTKIPVFCLLQPGARFTIIYSHGNATDCGAMYIMYAMIALALKVNVVGYDYTGYGTTGKNASSQQGSSDRPAGPQPTEKQTYLDIEAVYQWCVDSKLVSDPSKEIILYGQSVGSGPSCYLASNALAKLSRNRRSTPVAGLVLHSPILSGLRVVTDSRLLACFDIFPNISRIASVECPVFVIHGEMDNEVPVHHGKQLHEEVPERYRSEPWWVRNKGHNDVLMGNENEFLRRLSTFLQSDVTEHIAARDAAVAAATLGAVVPAASSGLSVAPTSEADAGNLLGGAGTAGRSVVSAGKGGNGVETTTGSPLSVGKPPSTTVEELTSSRGTHNSLTLSPRSSSAAYERPISSAGGIPIPPSSSPSISGSGSHPNASDSRTPSSSSVSSVFGSLMWGGARRRSQQNSSSTDGKTSNTDVASGMDDYFGVPSPRHQSGRRSTGAGTGTGVVSSAGALSGGTTSRSGSSGSALSVELLDKNSRRGAAGGGEGAGAAAVGRASESNRNSAHSSVGDRSSLVSVDMN